MTFSPGTLRTFAELLDQVQLPSTHPQLVEAAQQLTTARAELEAAIKELPIILPLDEPNIGQADLHLSPT